MVRTLRNPELKGDKKISERRAVISKAANEIFDFPETANQPPVDKCSQGQRRLRGKPPFLGRISMKRALVLVVIFLVVLGTMLPNPVWAGGPWRGGHGGGHHGGWWLPGAILGGLAFGAVAVVTAPFVALSAVAAAPPVAYEPPVVYTPPPAYAAPSPAYRRAPSYAPQVTAVQRQVVYPNGRYVLYGDGVRQPWQWVWVPSASPPPPPPPPPQQ